jgi:hypothetical protein
MRETNDIVTEVITTTSEREANYVHQGWSLSATSVIPPWTSSRIASHNQSDRDGVWVTKRTIVQALTLNVSLEELAAVSDFEDEIRAGLAKPTTFEKLQAIYQAIHVWSVSLDADELHELGMMQFNYLGAM